MNAQRAAALHETAPVLYRARDIVTQDGTSPECFAVQGGRVVASGEVGALRDRWPDAALADLGDACVVPGFNDAHIHLAISSEDMLHLDLSPARVTSLQELMQIVGAEARRTPPGGWVRGSRYDDVKMTEGRVLTRWDLDAAAPDVPALVVHVAGHWGVVNSRALELGGIDDDSEPPPRGVRPRRQRPSQRSTPRAGAVRVRLPGGE